MTTLSQLGSLELFSQSSTEPSQNQEPERILEVEIEKIVVNPDQPRRLFSQDELNELAESIKSVGLIHPPTVRPIQDGNKYEIISGERRFRAAKLAGFKKICCPRTLDKQMHLCTSCSDRKCSTCRP